MKSFADLAKAGTITAEEFKAVLTEYVDMSAAISMTTVIMLLRRISLSAADRATLIDIAKRGAADQSRQGHWRDAGYYRTVAEYLENPFK